MGSQAGDIAAPGAYLQIRIPFLGRWERREAGLEAVHTARCVRRDPEGVRLQPLVVLCQKEVPNNGTGFSGGFRTTTAGVRKDTVRLFWNRESQAQRGKAVFPASHSPSLTLSYAVSNFIYFFSEIDWKKRRFLNFL